MRALALLLAGVALAGADPQVTFKSQTNLVILNVFVRDGKGNPVEGLRKEDFQVFESGKPQTISVFEFQRLSLEPAPPSEPKVEPAEEKAEGKPAEPAAASVEPARSPYKDRRLLVLFFDFAAMPPADQIRAQESALDFLEKNLTASDLVQIMTSGSTLRIEQEFTDDREKLIEAIRRFRLGELDNLEGAPPVADDAADEQEALDATEEVELDLFNTDRRLSALETAARMLSSLPEKKAIISFSSGGGKTGNENQAQLRATVNAAVRANVSFYPVDVRGLLAMPPGGAASEASPKGTGVFTGLAQRKQREKHNDQQETLSALASDTGGKALLDSNDLGQGITQAQHDLQSYYTLGYYSPDPARNGRFRRVQVKLASRAGLRLDYRSGYYAPKEFHKFTGSDREKQLYDALLLGDPFTDLPLALEVNWFRLNPTKYFVPVAVKIPGHALPPVEKARPRTELDFIAQVRDARGRVAASVRDGIRVKLPEAEAGELTRRAIVYDAGFTLPPGAYRIKFLVRENQTGRMGTFETRFSIPSQPEGLLLSTVVWGAQREPLAAAVGVAEKNNKSMANHPLIQEGQKLVPSVTRVFRASQKAFVYLEAYDPQSARDLAAAVSFYRGRRKVFESEPVRAAAAIANRPGAVPLRFQVPLEKLRPGRYIAQVTVVDPAGQRFAVARTPLVVAK
ncbi:MAG: VWA domain-containing protein [Acidobacteria bacterium]|nr:VWA domain-containing protein [Acidobacteriota bacterium]